MLVELPCWIYWYLDVLSFFCFPVKCAEVIFMAFLRIIVASDMYIVILCYQNLSFGRRRASNLPPWGPCWQLGDTLGTMGATGRTRGGSESDDGKYCSEPLELHLESVSF